MNAKINLSIGDKHQNLLRILRAVNDKELKHSATFGCNEIGILIEAKSIVTENLHFLFVEFIFRHIFYYNFNIYYIT